MSQHDCNKVLSKVYLALDGAMTTDEEKAFLADLNKCSCCLDHYQIERSFKDFLTAKIERKCVDNSMVSSIKSQLRETTIS